MYNYKTMGCMAMEVAESMVTLVCLKKATSGDYNSKIGHFGLEAHKPLITV